MKIVHFAVDDKFIPFIQETFEQVFPDKNYYRVPGNPKEGLKFVRPASNVCIVGERYWDSSDVADDLQDCDCLIIHFMTRWFMEGILKAPPKCLVVWVGWGADYYYLIEPLLGNLLLPDTTKLSSELIKPRSWCDLLFKALQKPSKVFRYIRRKLMLDRSIHDVIGRIDLLWVNPEEMSMIETALPGFRGQFHRICYYSAEDTFSVGPDKMSGPDILIGNSATPTNNHLEAFTLISKLQLDDRKIVVPLSYGDQSYGDAIERIGKNLFGSRLVALRHFMPLADYYHAISSCGTVIMNHVRQQAGTTIAAALYKGAKIYLRKENPVFAFYRNMGMRLFSIQEDIVDNDELWSPLSSEEHAAHKRILENYWGRSAALECIAALNDQVQKKCS